MLYGIKKVNKFESEKSELCKTVNECIADILSDVNMHDFLNMYQYLMF